MAALKRLEKLFFSRLQLDLGFAEDVGMDEVWLLPSHAKLIELPATLFNPVEKRVFINLCRASAAIPLAMDAIVRHGCFDAIHEICRAAYVNARHGSAVRSSKINYSIWHPWLYYLYG